MAASLTRLIEQKEGFGARTFVHDHYELVLDGG